MAGTVRPLVAGNWKMNGLSASMAELNGIKAGIRHSAEKHRYYGFPFFP